MYIFMGYLLFARLFVVALGLATLLGAVGLHAAPSGGRVTAGAGDLSNPLLIQQHSDTLTTSWQSFDIAKGEVVRITQPSASSLISIKVRNDATTNISGTLTANGRVSLENPAGIRFNEGSVVNVGGLLASARAGDIVARGSITSPQGKVHFQSLGKENVVNIGGAVQASRVIVEGANEVRIAATSGSGADIRASEEVLIGGDYQGEGKITNSQLTHIEPNTSIIAPRVIVWSDGSTFFEGKIDATQESNGGFVEISGKTFLASFNLSDIKAGELLIDPEAIFIKVAILSSNGLITNGGGEVRKDAGYSVATFTPRAIKNFNGNVILRARSSITVSNSINKTNGGLTLDAPTLNINSNITTSGNLTLTNVATLNGANFITLQGSKVILNGASTVTMTNSNRGTTIFRGTTSVVINSIINQTSGRLILNAPRLDINNNITSNISLSLRNANSINFPTSGIITLTAPSIEITNTENALWHGSSKVTLRGTQRIDIPTHVFKIGGSLVLDTPTFTTHGISTVGDLTLNNVSTLNVTLVADDTVFVILGGSNMNINGATKITVTSTDNNAVIVFSGESSFTSNSIINQTSGSLVLNSPILNINKDITSVNRLGLNNAAAINFPTGGNSPPITLEGEAIDISGSSATSSTTLTTSSGGSLTFIGTDSITIRSTINQPNGTLTLSTQTLRIDNSITVASALIISDVANINFPTGIVNNAITLMGTDAIVISGAETITLAGSGTVTLKSAGSIPINSAINQTSGALTLDTPRLSIAGSGIITSGNLTLKNIATLNNALATTAPVTLEGSNVSISDVETITMTSTRGGGIIFNGTTSITTSSTINQTSGTLTLNTPTLNTNRNISSIGSLSLINVTALNNTAPSSSEHIILGGSNMSLSGATTTTISSSNSVLTIFRGTASVTINNTINQTSGSLTLRAPSLNIFSNITSSGTLRAENTSTINIQSATSENIILTGRWLTIDGIATANNSGGITNIVAAGKTLNLVGTDGIRIGSSLQASSPLLLDSPILNINNNINATGALLTLALHATLNFPLETDSTITFSAGNITLKRSARATGDGLTNSVSVKGNEGKFVATNIATIDVPITSSTTDLTFEGAFVNVNANLSADALLEIKASTLINFSTSSHVSLTANETIKLTSTAPEGTVITASNKNLSVNAGALVVDGIIDIGTGTLEISALRLSTPSASSEIRANTFSFTYYHFGYSSSTPPITKSATEISLTVSSGARISVGGAGTSQYDRGLTTISSARTNSIQTYSLSLDGAVKRGVVLKVNAFSLSAYASDDTTPINTNITIETRTVVTLNSIEIMMGDLSLSSQGDIKVTSDISLGEYDLTLKTQALGKILFSKSADVTLTGNIVSLTSARAPSQAERGLNVMVVGTQSVTLSGNLNVAAITLESVAITFPTSLSTSHLTLNYLETGELNLRESVFQNGRSLTINAFEKNVSFNFSDVIFENASFTISALDVELIKENVSLTANSISITLTKIANSLRNSSTVPNASLSLTANNSIILTIPQINLTNRTPTSGAQFSIALNGSAIATFTRSSVVTARAVSVHGSINGLDGLSFTSTAQPMAFSSTANSSISVAGNLSISSAAGAPTTPSNKNLTLLVSSGLLTLAGNYDIGTGTLFVTAQSFSGNPSFNTAIFDITYTGTLDIALPNWVIETDKDLSFTAQTASITPPRTITLGAGNLKLNAQGGSINYSNNTNFSANNITLHSAMAFAYVALETLTLTALEDISLSGHFALNGSSGALNLSAASITSTATLTRNDLNITWTSTSASVPSWAVVENKNLSVSALTATLELPDSIDIGTGDLTLSATAMSGTPSITRGALTLIWTGTTASLPSWAVVANKDLVIQATSADISVPASLAMGSGSLTLDAVAGALVFASTSLSGGSITLKSKTQPRASDQAATIDATNITLSGKFNFGTGGLTLKASDITTQDDFALTRGGLFITWKGTSATIPAWAMVADKNLSVSALTATLTLPDSIDIGTGDLTLSATAMSGAPSITPNITRGLLTLIWTGTTASVPSWAIEANKNLSVSALTATLELPDSIDIGTGDLTLSATAMSGTPNITRGLLTLIWTGTTASVPSWAVEANKDLIVQATSADISVPASIVLGSGSLTLDAIAGALVFASTSLSGGNIILKSKTQPSASTQAATIDATNITLSGKFNLGTGGLTLKANSITTQDEFALTRGGLSITWKGASATIPNWAIVADKDLSVSALTATLELPDNINIGTGNLTLSATAMSGTPSITRGALTLIWTGTTASLPSWAVVANKDLVIQATSADISVPASLALGSGSLTLDAVAGALVFASVNLSGGSITLKSKTQPRASNQAATIDATNITLSGKFNLGTGGLTLKANSITTQDEFALTRGGLFITWKGTSATIPAWAMVADKNLSVSALTATLELPDSIDIGTGDLTLSATAMSGTPNITRGLLTLIWTGTTASVPSWAVEVDKDLIVQATSADISVPASVVLGSGSLTLDAVAGALVFASANLSGGNIILKSKTQPSTSAQDTSAQDTSAQETTIDATNITLSGKFNFGTGGLILKANSITTQDDFALTRGGLSITWKGNTAFIPSWAVVENKDLTIIAAKADISVPVSFSLGSGDLTLDAVVGALVFASVNLSGGSITLKSKTQPSTSNRDATIDALNTITLSGKFNFGTGDLTLKASDISTQDEFALTRGSLFITWKGASATIPAWAIVADKNLSVTALTATLELPANIDIGTGDLTLSATAMSGTPSITRELLTLIWIGDSASVPDWAVVEDKNLIVQATKADISVPTSLALGLGDLTLDAITAALAFDSSTSTNLSGRSITLKSKTQPRASNQKATIDVSTRMTLSGKFNFGTGDLDLKGDSITTQNDFAFIRRGLFILWRGGEAPVPSWAIEEGKDLTITAREASISVPNRFLIGSGNLVLEAKLGGINFDNSAPTKISASSITLIANAIHRASNQNLHLLSASVLLLSGDFSIGTGALSLEAQFIDYKAHFIRGDLSITWSSTSATIPDWAIEQDKNLSVTALITKLVLPSALDIGAGNLSLTAPELFVLGDFSLTRNALSLTLTGETDFVIPNWAIARDKSLSITTTQSNINAPASMDLGTGDFTLHTQEGAINFDKTSPTRFVANNITLISTSFLAVNNQNAEFIAAEELSLGGFMLFGEGDLTLNAQNIIFQEITQLGATNIRFTTNTKDEDITNIKDESVSIVATNDLVFENKAGNTVINLGVTTLSAGNNMIFRSNTFVFAYSLHLGPSLDAGRRDITLTTTSFISFADTRATIITGGNVSLMSPNRQQIPSDRNLIIRARGDIELEGSFFIGDGNALFYAGDKRGLGVIRFIATPSFRAGDYRLEQNGGLFPRKKPATFRSGDNSIDVIPLLIYTGIEVEYRVDWGRQLFVLNGSKDITLLDLQAFGENHQGFDFTNGVFDIGDNALTLITSGDIILPIALTERGIVIKARRITLRGRRLISADSLKQLTSHLTLEARESIVLDIDVTSNYNFVIDSASLSFSVQKAVNILAANIHIYAENQPEKNYQNVSLLAHNNIYLRGSLNIGLATLVLQAGEKINLERAESENEKDVEIKANRIIYRTLVNEEETAEGASSHNLMLNAENDIHLDTNLVLGSHIALRAGGSIITPESDEGFVIKALGKGKNLIFEQKYAARVNGNINLSASGNIVLRGALDRGEGFIVLNSNGLLDIQDTLRILGSDIDFTYSMVLLPSGHRLVLRQRSPSFAAPSNEGS